MPLVKEPFESLTVSPCRKPADRDAAASCVGRSACAANAAAERVLAPRPEPWSDRSNGLSLPSADLKSRDFRKILLIKLSAVGDVVQTMPVLNALRRRYPSAQIDWLVTPAIAELLRHNPAISNVIEFARDDWSKPWTLTPFVNYARLAARLRADGYDLVVDMHGQFRTAVFVLATGAPVRIGFDRPRASVWRCFAAKLFRPKRANMRGKARARAAGSPTRTIFRCRRSIFMRSTVISASVRCSACRRPAPDFPFPFPKQRTRASTRCCASAALPGRLSSPWRRARSGKPSIGAPASSPRWRGTSSRKGFAVALMGSRRERDCVRRRGTARPRCGRYRRRHHTDRARRRSSAARPSASPTIPGPMHLAVALDRPVVEHFRPDRSGLDRAVWAAGAVLQAGVPCSPCLLRQLSRCRHGHVCMEDVSARTVIDRMEHDARRERPAHPRRCAEHILYGRLTGPLSGGPHFCVAS